MTETTQAAVVPESVNAAAEAVAAAAKLAAKAAIDSATPAKNVDIKAMAEAEAKVNEAAQKALDAQKAMEALKAGAATPAEKPVAAEKPAEKVAAPVPPPAVAPSSGTPAKRGPGRPKMTDEEKAAAKAAREALKAAGPAPKQPKAPKAAKKEKKVKAAKAAKTVQVKKTVQAKTVQKKTVQKAKTAQTAQGVQHFGQNGPKIKDCTFETLNANELAVLRSLGVEGKRVAANLTTIAGACWPKLNEVKAGSWARNSLRKLVRGRLVEKLERGEYQQTEDGRAEAKRSMK